MDRDNGSSHLKHLEGTWLKKTTVFPVDCTQGTVSPQATSGIHPILAKVINWWVEWDKASFTNPFSDMDAT